ncbi:hypothetical protein D9615_006987 [Tricholomella constricta]|uniref:Uncharacterized protein n=1 Tax=Tricholomella constricta TaxID=117010 RepID=A0A8H5H8V1_9AGAR|nr:hypothetical protein D9615_006987 [Tricholomella constricta]
MTPTDASLLRIVGLDMLVSLASTLTLTFLYGMLVLFFAFSTASLLKRGLKARPTKIMFAATLTSFVLATISWSCEVASYALYIRCLLVDINVNSITADFIMDVEFAFIGLLQNWAVYLLIIMSDGIVIWRAWVLFAQDRWIMIAPCFMFFATCVVNVAYISFYSRGDWKAPFKANHPLSSINIVFESALALSIGTNAVGTLLILYKLWAHREFRHSLALQNERSPAQQTMLILVESGVVFLGIQLANLITCFIPFNRSSALDCAQEVVWELYAMFPALYPSMVVYIVDQQCSLAETLGFNMSPLRFKPEDAEMRLGMEQQLATIGHLPSARTVRIRDTLDSQVGVIPLPRESETAEITQTDGVGNSSS